MMPQAAKRSESKGWREEPVCSKWVSISGDTAYKNILDCTNKTQFNKLDESGGTELEEHMPHFDKVGK